MSAEVEKRNLQNMDTLDFTGWNNLDWEVFSGLHTDDVHVAVAGQVTEGLPAHAAAVKGMVDAMGHVKVASHPIGFGSGDWTCVVGETETGQRMVTVARWRDGKVAEEYVWM